MNGCDREALVLDLVRSGRVDAELDAHIATCDSCSELALVATAITADHHDALRGAAVPPSGLVWWRMQRRAAGEAARSASRAVLAAQTVAFAAAIVIAFAVLRAFGGASLNALRNLMHMPSAATLAQWSLPLAFTLFVCLALAPVALYFAFERD